MSDSGTGSRRSLLGRLLTQPALIVFLLCLGLGSIIVAWRVSVSAEAARARAQAQALAQATLVESQFSRAISAGEVLGALARQAGGAVPDFQKVAGELFAARPGLASLELQPGGVVSDIVPRSGNERAIGVNVLKDPARSAGANLAIQSRVLTVAGPLPLYHGEPGIVVRVPVFQRGRDGRDYFWGFVAVSMRLSEALTRAGLDEVSTRCYNYAFSVPASAGQRAVAIGGRGGPPPKDAVRHQVRAQNLEFSLALWPRGGGGWINTTKLLVESLGVLFASALLGLLTNLLGTHRHLETTVSDADQRVIRETAERRKAEEGFSRLKDGAAATQAELEQTRSALRRAESAVAETQARLDAAARSAADEAAKARQAEVGETRAALGQAQQTISQLQARLDAAARAEKETAATAQKQRREDQAAIAGLQSSLESAARVAREAAETNAAKVQKLEANNRQLRERLAAAEKLEARVAELTALLEETEAKSQRQRDASARSQGAPATEPVGAAPDQPVNNEAVLPAVEPAAQPSPAPAEPAPPSRETSATAAEKDLAPGRGQSEAALPNGASAIEVSPAPTPNPGAESPAPPTLSEPPKSPAAEKPAKAPRRKRSRRDDQMDLFGSQPVAGQAPPKPAANLESAPKPKEDKPAPARRLAPPPPVNPPELRKAVNEILPLLTDQDPGAKDCLKANRDTFRSAFSPEGYAEFEQFVKNSDFGAALEDLKKAARKNGISA